MQGHPFAQHSPLALHGRGPGGQTVADQVAHALVSVSATSTFPLVMGIYSAVLGLFIPSGGGKSIIEAPHVIRRPTHQKSMDQGAIA